MLGFIIEWHDEDRWQVLRARKVRVHLGRCPEALPPAGLGDHNYFGIVSTDDVDLLHSEIVGRDAIILSAPGNRPQGVRKMAVATPEGHRMMFAQAIQRQPTPADTCAKHRSRQGAPGDDIGSSPMTRHSHV